MKIAIRYTITQRASGEQKRIVIVGNSILHCQVMANSNFLDNFCDVELRFFTEINSYATSGIFNEDSWTNCTEDTEIQPNSRLSDNEEQRQSSLK